MSEQIESDRYRVNAPGVAHETIDGEVVVINLRSGDYYSCLGSATDAWNAIAAGATRQEVAGRISAAYETGGADVAADVAAFVQTLCDEQLIVPLDGAGAAPVGEGDGPDGHDGASPGGGEYEPPRIEKFTDMADLIILDPVHDVSDEGWPHAPTS